MDNYKQKLSDIINSNYTPLTDIDTFVRYFPELRESDDERVRKALIHYFREQDGILTAVDCVPVKDIISWIEKQGEKVANNNGYEYVDLGLPSGLKWCKTDVGAFKEGDYGLYFSWGGTVGYPDAKNGKEFTWGDYEFGDIKKISKYNNSDGKTVLDPEDDAATVNMGPGWRMPTEKEYEELKYNTTSEWIENYNSTGHNVLKLTSKINGNYIILPASGFCCWSGIGNVGSNGYFWTSSRNTSDARDGQYLVVDNIGRYTHGSYRFYGQPVRGVHV